MWSIYTMDYYSPIRRDEIGSSVVMWMGLESVIKSKVSQKEKNKYHILIYIYILEKGMATHSTILTWRIPCTEEPGRLQSMGSQRV